MKEFAKEGLSIMIKLNGITKEYNSDGISFKALSDIDITINRGDMVAIMGRSGSGKSTLLNIIGGLDSPTSGSYTFDDTVLDVNDVKFMDKFRKNKVAFVFQQFALLGDYTVYDNIELPLRARNIPAAERKKRINEVMERLEISKLKKKLPSKISGGEQQRCAIARALVTGNELILADEPTGALDRTTGQEIMNLIKELNREGKTVLIVTHDEKIAAQANRIIYLEDGKIKA